MDGKIIVCVAGGIVLTAAAGLGIKHFVLDKADTKDEKTSIDVTDVTIVLTAINKLGEKYNVTLSDEQAAILAVGLCKKAKEQSEKRWTAAQLVKNANALATTIGLKDIKFG